MKPIIISVIEDKDGYIKIKKEDFERYVEQAYEAGKAEKQPYLPTAPWRYGEATCKSPARELNSSSKRIDYAEIMCGSGGDVNG